MTILLEIFLHAALVIAVIILLTRLHGLRSFSKMSGFDFAITVSVGSVLAGVITTLSTPLWHFVTALVALFAVQIVLSQSRALAQGQQDPRQRAAAYHGKRKTNCRKSGEGRYDAG
ncbi:hypothetical protein AB2B41_02970 [Marimonas sp. MJW-29]|uniref:DUF421 domain-containing protein n=1 Tax=Sulfitobacter sediminis TaxID=3234186 RepID=A0ABV3RI49_9RHOB